MGLFLGLGYGVKLGEKLLADFKLRKRGQGQLRFFKKREEFGAGGAGPEMSFNELALVWVCLAFRVKG
jgi:hypothetical protein